MKTNVNTSVVSLREAGYTWPKIAEVVGMSVEGARQVYIRAEQRANRERETTIEEACNRLKSVSTNVTAIHAMQQTINKELVSTYVGHQLIDAMDKLNTYAETLVAQLVRPRKEPTKIYKIKHVAKAEKPTTEKAAAPATERNRSTQYYHERQDAGRQLIERWVAEKHTPEEEEKMKPTWTTLALWFGLIKELKKNKLI